MRRISSKSEAIRYQRSSRTRFSSPTWLTQCTRYLSLQWCQRCFPPLVAMRFHPSQVSQRTIDLNQRCWNQRSLPQVPQSPANRSRSESPRPPTLTQIRPMSLLQRRNSLLEASKSKSPINSGNMAVRPRRAAPKMVPLPLRYVRSWKPTTASTGPSEAALWKARFELYDKDLPEVKEVCARILGLPEGEEATQEDFDSSPGF